MNSIRFKVNSPDHFFLGFERFTAQMLFADWCVGVRGLLQRPRVPELGYFFLVPIAFSVSILIRLTAAAWISVNRNDPSADKQRG
jgi:hypothetical protein